MAHCPMCDGEGALLGALGYLKWFRCIQCGLDFSKKFNPRKRKQGNK